VAEGQRIAGEAPSFVAALDVPATWEDLAALNLPSLAGQRFLHVGCGEGFHCGFAQWAGAHRVVGLDEDGSALEQARALVPAAEFVQGPPDRPWTESFDVILLATGFEQVVDQAGLIEHLVRLLSDQGVLVLATPVLLQKRGKAFREVQLASGDVVRVPEDRAIRELCVLDGFSYRLVAKGKSSEGDATTRVVYHLGPPARDAYLLIQPGSFGKTFKANQLLQMRGTKYVGLDRVLKAIKREPSLVSAPFAEILAGVTDRSLDVAYEAIFRQGLDGELLDVAFAGLGDATPVIDSYVPAWAHERFVASVAARGFRAVVLAWEHSIQVLDPGEAHRRLTAFQEWAATNWRRPAETLVNGMVPGSAGLMAGAEPEVAANAVDDLRAEFAAVLADREAVLADREAVIADREMIRAQRDDLQAAAQAAQAERLRAEAAAAQIRRERDAALADLQRYSRESATAMAQYEVLKGQLAAVRAELEKGSEEDRPARTSQWVPRVGFEPTLDGV
jgi:SAM-dependent methyltransferase